VTASVLSRVPRLRGQDGLWRYIDPSLIIASGAITALGTLKLVMGLPLFAPLVAVTWLAVRALYPPAAK